MIDEQIDLTEVIESLIRKTAERFDHAITFASAGQLSQMARGIYDLAIALETLRMIGEAQDRPAQLNG